MSFTGIYSSFYANLTKPTDLILDNHFQLKTMVREFFSKIKEVVVINFSVYCDNSEEPRIKKALKVEEVSEVECKDLEKIVREWLSCAKAKADQNALLLPNLINDHLPTSLSTFRLDDIFIASIGVCTGLMSAIVDEKVLNENEKMFICKLDESDMQDTIQAIALVGINTLNDEHHLKIYYLASKPYNLVAPINKHQPNRVSGAATKLLDHFKENVCPPLNLKRMELIPTKTSEDFYKNYGFVENASGMYLDIKSAS